MRGETRTWYALEFEPGFNRMKPTYPYMVKVHRYTSLRARNDRLHLERNRIPGAKQSWVKCNSTNHFVNMAWKKYQEERGPWPVTLTITDKRERMSKKFFYAREALYVGNLLSPSCFVHRYTTIQDRDDAIARGGGQPKWAALGSSDELVSRAKARALAQAETWPVEILRNPRQA